MIKIFSRKGDDGYTSLTNGKKIKKTASLIELMGGLDELNSFLGFAAEGLCALTTLKDLLQKLYRIQGELFELGSAAISGQKFLVGSPNVTQLEAEIDFFTGELPVLNCFVLPGGGEIAVRFHLARAVCRRVERNAFAAADNNADMPILGKYLNRLSDWLYIVARYISYKSNIDEIAWKHSR